MGQAETQENGKFFIAASSCVLFVTVSMLRIQSMNETGADFLLASGLIVFLWTILALLISKLIGRVNRKFETGSIIFLSWFLSAVFLLSEQNISLAGEYPRTFSKCVEIQAKGLPNNAAQIVIAQCRREFPES